MYSHVFFDAEPDSRMVMTNVVGTLNMLGLAKRVGARFLLTSTIEVYGDLLQHPQVETYWGNAKSYCNDFKRESAVVAIGELLLMRLQWSLKNLWSKARRMLSLRSRLDRKTALMPRRKILQLRDPRRISAKMLQTDEKAKKERKKRKEFEIFVGGLSRDAIEDVMRVFQNVDEVVEVRMHKEVSGKNKGYAFVRFATKEQVARALAEMKYHVIRGKRCGTAPSEDDDTLFVGSICNTWTKEDIRQKLKDYGVERGSKHVNRQKERFWICWFHFS
ncbi:hypothetical protein L1987_27594 [Smallanthus sonchifolius]|uniref:Uncharacterized protein n=1 Tax=Smallanthus sonchifolius TaxID=185202 RepID=A0ACB9ID64_9ASTR|nr:hypothetical protein L1987_27594 [Smallanthus sonchifolius]